MNNHKYQSINQTYKFRSSETISIKCYDNPSPIHQMTNQLLFLTAYIVKSACRFDLEFLELKY